jgi:hypothetical protein
MTTPILFAAAAIADYDRRTPAQQRDLQERLSRITEYSVAEIGEDSGSIEYQDQDGVLLIGFSENANVAKVLAEFPRQASLALAERNQDMKPTAKLRLRLAFAMGPTLPGRAARTGQAAIEAGRLSNAAPLRAALAGCAADLAMIITDDLYRTYVMQQFRPDLKPGDFLSASVEDPERGFQPSVWITLPGQVELTAPRKSARQEGRELWHRISRPNPNRPVIAAVAGAIVLGSLGLAAALIAKSSGSTAPPGSPPTSPSSPARVSAHSSPVLSAGTVIEYGDWRPGIVVYANTGAASTDLPVIPFNQGVVIVCVAPNESGITTINKFYLIGSGKWKGTYASANEFTNGGPKGDPADPNIDPAVPPCRDHA